MKALFYLLILFLPSLVFGYNLKLRDGSVLYDIKLRAKTDLGIQVEHRDGTDFIDYSRIPVPELFTWGFEENKYRAIAPSSIPPPTSTQSSNARPTRLYQPTTPPTTTTTRSSASSGTASSYTPPQSSPSARSQCAATTKKGYRCSRNAQSGRGYCYQHP